MHSPRSTLRVALLVGLVVAAAAAPSPSAASSPSTAPPNGPAFREAPVVQAFALQIDPVSFARETFVMSKVDVVAGVPVVELSERTRDTLQKAAIDHVLRTVLRNGDVAQDSFGRYLLDSLVDCYGADIAQNVARSCRPSADAYRRVLRAIHDRTRSPAT